MELQKTLWNKYQIDPIASLEIFVNAPDTGVHSNKAQLHVIEILEKFLEKNRTRTKVVEQLRKLGEWAAGGGENGA